VQRQSNKRPLARPLQAGHESLQHSRPDTVHESLTLPHDDQAVVMQAARFVRDLRKNSGLTQADLARRMGVSQAVIARLESGNGRRGMTIQMFSRVASACERSVIVKAAPGDSVAASKARLQFASR